MVLSILLAFLLWVYVGNDPNSVDTGTLRNVRVVFSGLEKLEERGLMISEGAEQTVNLQLSARGEVWSRLNQGDTTVVVDVSGITEPGEQSVAITCLLYTSSFRRRAQNRWCSPPTPPMG